MRGKNPVLHRFSALVWIAFLTARVCGPRTRPPATEQGAEHPSRREASADVRAALTPDQHGRVPATNQCLLGV